MMNLAPRCAGLTQGLQAPESAPLNHGVLSLAARSELLINGSYCVCVQTVVLLGHSTGCQDNIRYMQKYSRETPHLAGVILQAPVSPPSLTSPL